MDWLFAAVRRGRRGAVAGDLPIAAGPLPPMCRIDYHKPTVVMAHRGLARYATENTGPAIRLAAMAGVNGIELDVRFTRDGVPVLFHDRTLARLAARPQRRRIGDLTWRELAHVAVVPANRIMKLETFLADFAAPFRWIMLDLKDARRGTLTEAHLAAVAEGLNRHGAVDRTLVDAASQRCVGFLLARGLHGSLREPAASPAELRAMGVRYVSMAAHHARPWYEHHGGWADLAVTVICPPDVGQAMWFIERDAFAVITDAVEETLDAMMARGYLTRRDVNLPVE